MDELLKQRVMAAIVGFNFTLIIFHIALYLMYGCESWGVFLYRLLISVGVGAVVAGGAYIGVQMTQK